MGRLDGEPDKFQDVDQAHRLVGIVVHDQDV